MSRPLRAAVVGTGFIGPVHVEALRRIGVEVVGIVGANIEGAQRRADEMLVPATFDSIDALLAETDPDCIHITTPNHLHAPMVSQVLAAGKHVVCEKPLAMSAREGMELLQIAEESGLVHAVNFNLRFYAHCHQVKAMIGNGDLGSIYLIHGKYLQDWLLKATDWNWRLESSLGGEIRAVADIGSHWLDLVSFVTGKRIVEVCADFGTLLPVRRKPLKPLATFAGKELDPEDYQEVEIATEDYASILLRFEGGAQGVLTVSQVSAGRKNHLALEIDGSTASVAWNSETPEELWIGRRDSPSELMLRDPGLLADEARAITSYPGGHAEGFPDTFKQLYRKVYTAIEAGGPPTHPEYPTFADGLHALELGEAILKSARSRSWVETDVID
ncbi:MAG: Gfo/Idh/MocA family protein [Thermomicrobiales bacterium]